MNERPSVSQTDRLITLIGSLVEPLGYEVVYVEVLTHRQKTLRVFIDFVRTPKPDENGVVTGDWPSIGIEDCVKASRALSQPLNPEESELSALDVHFDGAYELEVSSPGVDRPLRQPKDFERFKERNVRIHTFRSLTQDEIGNEAYFAKNPKQKNFVGVLKGLKGERLSLAVGDLSGNAKKEKQGKKFKAKAKTGALDSNSNTGPNNGMEISIPLALVSKANLEPIFDFSDSE